MDDNQRPVAPESENALSRRDFTAISVAGAAAAIATTAKAGLPVVQKDVTITTPDGSAEAVFIHPAGTGSWPAVLIHTDAFGLRPAFRSMAARMAADGYAVLVPNPFYRTSKMPAVAPGTTMATPGFREKLAEMRKPHTAEGVGKDTVAYFAWLDAQKEVKKGAKAGVQGYCMGGPMTFQSAAALPNRIGGAATFHGGGLVTPGADSPHLLIAKMNPQIQLLIAVADNDDKNAPTDKDVLRKTFDEQKRRAEIKVYTGCMHGWCVTDGAVYAAAGAEDAWNKTMAIYKSRLV